MHPTIEYLAVAILVGHSIKTMARYFESITFHQKTSKIVDVKSKEIDDGDFKTFDMDYL